MPAEIVVIPEPQTLPVGACPTELQALLDLFAAHMRVRIPAGITQLIAQSQQPDVGDQDAVWVKLDPTTGHGLGIYVWDLNAVADEEDDQWTRIDTAPIYFLDTGAENALVVATGENYPSLVAITGKLFLVKVAHDNTGSSVSLQVDSLAASPIHKVDGTNLEVGQIKEGMVLATVWDGTQFQALNHAQKALFASDVRSAFTVTAEFNVPLQNEAVSIPNPTGVQPYFLRIVAVCKIANTDGYSINDEVDITGIAADHDSATTNDAPAYTVSCTPTTLTVAATKAESGQSYAAKGGGLANWDVAVALNAWKLKAYIL